MDTLSIILIIDEQIGVLAHRNKTDFIIDSIFQLPFQATDRNKVRVVLDARTQLGYMAKSKAENVKSFGDILHQFLESKTHERRT